MCSVGSSTNKQIYLPSTQSLRSLDIYCSKFEFELASCNRFQLTSLKANTRAEFSLQQFICPESLENLAIQAST